MADASGEFDYIVIGGGSAGSAVTGRLAHDGTKTVCLLEAGGRNNGIRVRTPGLFPFLPESANYKFDTIPQKGLNGRIGYQPRGRGLGGSSAINAMVYIRGNAWDYNNWAGELGCDGWAYEDVLPYFMRSEGNVRGGGPHHGGAGPLGVSDQLWANPTSMSSHCGASPISTFALIRWFSGWLSKTGKSLALRSSAAALASLCARATESSCQRARSTVRKS